MSTPTPQSPFAAIQAIQDEQREGYATETTASNPVEPVPEVPTDPYAHLKQAWVEGRPIRCRDVRGDWTPWFKKGGGFGYGWDVPPDRYEIEPLPADKDLDPAPAVKLTDEHLGNMAAIASGACDLICKPRATAFAHAVREAVEKGQAEEIARLTAKSEEMCQAFVAEAAKKHEALAIIEQAIEMVNTLGTTKDNLPKAINAKIMQRDEFHDATLKKLDAAKEDIARLLKLDATNRENCDRTHKALVESQLLQLETQKALAKANAELERMQWRPVSVKPTREDADEGGFLTVLRGDKLTAIVQWDANGFNPDFDWRQTSQALRYTKWRPAALPPAPTAEEVQRLEFEKACVQFDVSFTRDIGGNYRDSRTLVLFEVWMLARASAESKPLTQQEERK